MPGTRDNGPAAQLFTRPARATARPDSLRPPGPASGPARGQRPGSDGGARHQGTPTLTGKGPGTGGVTSHRCPVPGCVVMVAPRRLMCRGHWHLVPKPLRDLVWATWRSGAGAHTPGHRHAIHQAVHAATAAQAPGRSQEIPHA